MPDTIHDLLAAYARTQRALALEAEHYEASRQELLAPISLELNELAMQHEAHVGPLRTEATALEAQIKAAVLEDGFSAKGFGYQAVFTKGRISWADDWLQGYAVSHPEVLQARIEGKPSVSIRAVKTQGETA